MNRQVSGKIAWPLIILSLASFLAAFFYREPIKDWWFFRSYTPGFFAKELSNDANFSDKGERLFYRGDPAVVSSEIIEDNCGSGHNLGCIATGPKIYILEYGDSEKEEDQAIVTAAHEMLHLAYFRLDANERENINALLEDEMEVLRDRAVLERIRSYDFEQQLDEAHSIIATEVKDLSPPLESYYDQYFESRDQVLEAFDSSRSLID